MQEGVKYDSGKPRLAEMMQDFRRPLSAVCGVWEFGADKYQKSNWKYVDNAVDRYTNALLRHLMAEAEQPLDAESGLLHAAHVAWNALARLYFIMQQPKVDESDIVRHVEEITIPKRFYGALSGLTENATKYTLGVPKND